MNIIILLSSIVTVLNFSLIAGDNVSDKTTIAYLGIYATKVNPNLSHQLNLPENLYLNVERVEKNSPAEQSGVQEFDLLLQLNDQILVNQEQLKYLVRSKKPIEEVTLTLLRRGKKQKITLKLGEIELPEKIGSQNTQLSDRFSNRDPFSTDGFFNNPKGIRDFMDRYSANPFFDYIPNNGSSRKTPSNPQLDDPLHPKINIDSFSSQSSHSQVMITDEEGTLEWIEKNGQKSLRATDPNGQVLFDGPIDSLEDRIKLSDNLKSRLEELEGNLNAR